MSAQDLGHPKETRRMWRRWLAIALVAFVAAFLVWLLSLRYFSAQELARAETRLSLYRSTVLAEVERFEHLTDILAVDPFVVSALSNGGGDAINDRLANFAGSAGLEAIFLMQGDGLTIGASNAGQDGSFLGQNYAFRPYFQGALRGERATFYGIGATTGRPGYFIAGPVENGSGGIIGVVAVKIDLAPFETTWRDAGEQVILSDQSGVVLLASDPSWRYRVLQPLTDAERAAIQAARQFPGQELAALDWQQTSRASRVRVDGAIRLYVTNDDLPNGWHLHYLAGNQRPLTQAYLLAGGCIVILAIALLFAEAQRSRRLGLALERAEREEVALRRSNELLAGEIEDRRRAELRLQETQAELQSANRLATLGELAASVTHELGQPIAAMRNHLVAHELAAEGTDQKLIRSVSGLVDRMEGITRQLKFFARSDAEPFETLDLRDSVAAVIELMQPSFQAEQVTVSYTRPPMPIEARGSRLRLEQVLTNLCRNGVDAMDQTKEPQLGIALFQTETQIVIEVSDNGHGLGGARMEDLQQPFFTTRESGQGMGLGLAISARILEDHGGALDASEDENGRTVFRLSLPVPLIPRAVAE